MNVKTNSPLAWILAIRPKTLVGAAVPVVIALAFAYKFCGNSLQIIPALLCLFFAFAMQILANLVNDYYDFRNGCDNGERLGPDRAYAQGWITFSAMKAGILIATICACLLGFPLIFYGGWPLIVVGAVCVLFAFLYTAGSYPLAYHGLGDLLVFVFFGIVPVCFTFFIQTKVFSLPVIIASIACGAVVDTMMMINNYRDRDTDAKTNKRTLVVRFGARVGELSYLLLGVGAVALCLIFIFYDMIFAAILPLLYLALHVAAYKEMIQINHGEALNALLEKNARNILIFGVLLTLGVVLS